IQRVALGLVNEQRKAKASEQRTRSHERGKSLVGKMSERDRLMLGLGLYWGEGFKRGHTVDLCNMDSELLSFYMSWLDTLGVDRRVIRASLAISPELNPSQEVAWWCDRLELRPEQFTKVVIKLSATSKRKTKRACYHGVLSLRVYRTTLMSLIKGMLD